MLAVARTSAVRLVSAAGTGYFYTVVRQRGKEKLVLRKFDPLGITLFNNNIWICFSVGG